MKLVKPEIELYGLVPTDYKGALKFIEMAGRTCYKSEDRITGTSAEPFVKRLIKAGHLAMVEHSNFVVCRSVDGYTKHSIAAMLGLLGKYLNYVIDTENEILYVGGSLTAWYQRAQEMHWATMFEPFVVRYGELFDIPMSECKFGTIWQMVPFDGIPKSLQRISAKFTCDRGVSHELVRHRPCSFAQESTRYVNYGGKDVEFVEPWWWEEEESRTLKEDFLEACLVSEMHYKDFIAFGYSPQAARALLPNALKTEIIVTADWEEWEHILKLRTAPGAHPDMVRVMSMLKSKMGEARLRS